MAKELNIDAGTTGLTVTANVYLLGVANVSGIACAETGANPTRPATPSAILTINKIAK